MQRLKVIYIKRTATEIPDSMMYLQTPKRPSLPPTPAYSTSTPLPPLLLIIHTLGTKLPLIDQFVGLSTPQSAPTKRPVVVKKDLPTLDSKAYAFISHSPATFPSQEPSIDNAPLARRKRRRTLPNELLILNKEFEIGLTPNKLRRLEIAAKVLMTEKAVQIWFQNKRQLLRKHLNQEKEVTELPPTPMPMVMPHMVVAVPVMVPHAPPPQMVLTLPPMPRVHLNLVGLIVSLTPTKPSLHKAHLFVLPPAHPVLPIKQRAALIPLSTAECDELNTLIDDLMLQHNHRLVLNETRKKQPAELNLTQGQTMTFKLAPLRLPLKVAQKLAECQDRKPLLDKTNENNQCVENLLKLKSGQWN